jgi:uncharacterized protein (TIGR02421 family)
MQKLSDADIIQRINYGATFEAEILDGSFDIIIHSYETPIISTAIHAGSQFRGMLATRCRLTKSERFYEEDPWTSEFIASMPIQLIAKDSRYEYDLNRPLATCIYQTAWGKKVWRYKLPEKEKKISINKHQTFYRVLDALVAQLEKKFKHCLIFDIHTYNYQRINRKTPTFDLGTRQINNDRWMPMIHATLKSLNSIQVDNLPVNAEENDVFVGNGYMISHINSRFENTLVLPIEIKKCFMNEISGKLYTDIFWELNSAFISAIHEISAKFLNKYCKNKTQLKKSEQIDPVIINIDRTLYDISKNLDTLKYINPINTAEEKKRFLQSKRPIKPKFRYHALTEDIFYLRKQLSQLPIHLIKNSEVQHLYQSSVANIQRKLNLLSRINSAEFLDVSIDYYGKPSNKEYQIAKAILDAPGLLQQQPKLINADELKRRMKQASADWQMPCKIKIQSNLVATAMVNNNQKTVLLNKKLKISDTMAESLIHHELGVHMSTTLNSFNQPLKILSSGLPDNTRTQEGLALLNEYHAGVLDIERLRTIALRVVAVNKMIKDSEFLLTLEYLMEAFNLDKEAAFDLSIRVHRAGGFTKDFLYLSGFAEALRLCDDKNFELLYCGKTSFEFFTTIEKMQNLALINPPTWVPERLHNRKHNGDKLEALIQQLQLLNTHTKLNAPSDTP